MALMRYQGTVQDAQGNIVPNAHIQVLLEQPGLPPAVCYSDALGTTSLGSEFDADTDGYFGFHATGGLYRIRAYTGPSANPTFERIWTSVPIGTAQAKDTEELTSGIHATPRGPWQIGDTYGLNAGVPDLVEVNGYNFITNEDNNTGNAPQTNPPASDTHWTLIGRADAALTSISTSSVAIGTGSKLFAVEVGRSWTLGMRLRPASSANPTTHWMEGPISAIGAGSVTLDVDRIGSGTGTRADWNIGVAGEAGEQGPEGDVTPEALAAQAAAEAAAAEAALQAAKLTGTSVTPVTIGTGTKVFETQVGKYFDPPMRVIISSDANPDTHSMFGIVTGYDEGSPGGTLTVAVSVAAGTGSRSDWTIRIAGPRGEQGPSGSLDFGALTAATPAMADKTVFGDADDANNAKGVTYAAWREALGFSIKVEAASDPTVNDNYGAGYIAGDRWINTTTNIAWVLVDDGAGDSPSLATWIRHQPYDAQLSSLIRQNSQGGAYTIVATDSGYHILHPSTDDIARTFTIPANASVPFAIGTVLTFVNEINTVTIAINTDTLALVGSGSTGSRTLGANGIATALKISATKWYISGVGLS